MSRAVEKSYSAYPLNNPDDLYTNAKRVGYKQGYEDAEREFEEWLKDMFIPERPTVYSQEAILDEFNRFLQSEQYGNE